MNLIARRDGSPMPAPVVDPAAPDRMRELLVHSELWGTPTEAEYHPELREDARRYMRGDELTPRGAGACALFLGEYFGETCADAWIVTGGVVFAARAVAELSGMMFHPLRREVTLFRRSLGSVPEDRQCVDDEDMMRVVARRVRAYLATLSDVDYAAAVAALGEYRKGPLPQRIATSFLVPDQARWVDEDIAAIPEWFAACPPTSGSRMHGLLLFAAGTEEQHARFVAAMRTARTSISNWCFTPQVTIDSLIDTLGPAAAVRVMTASPDYRHATGLTDVWWQGITPEGMETLLAIPADEARQVVVEALEELPEVERVRLRAVVAEDGLRLAALLDELKS
ncbi:hypothetical protein [Catenuloplanes japonicus]|uniref:hypothetical protein n=1 Tax=Catenuloplanes japonicus TaxID=33876 RepID=UPI0005274517|nr:hypothetical protein [Catenuloplanes japonicus]